MEYLVDKIEYNLLCVTAMDNGECAGNLNFEVDDGVLHIKYIYVDEKYRHQGVGSGLVKVAGSYVKDNRLDGTVVSITANLEQRSILQRFLIKNNFHIPRYDGFVITADINNISNSYLYNIPSDIDSLKGNLYKMNRLPIELKNDFEKNIRYSIDQSYLPENALGEIIPELSLAVEKEGRIASYIIFSEYENELYLSAAYVNSNNISDLINLLIYCFRMIKNDYDNLKIKTANYEGYNLFKKLMMGATVTYEVVLTSYRFF